MREAPARMWLAAPMDGEAADAIDRLGRAVDVTRVAVMPDVHLAADVFVGVAVRRHGCSIRRQWVATSDAACWLWRSIATRRCCKIRRWRGMR